MSYAKLRTMTAEPPLVALRARWVFPVNGPPIAGGVVTVRGERIVSVGPHDGLTPVRDLGDVAILPGLVNAHTHLEFSDLAAPLGTRGMPLPEWIRQVVMHRRAAASVDANVSGSRAIAQGLSESASGGTALLGEIATGDWRRECFAGSSVASFVFHESIAPTTDRVAQTIEAAQHFLETSPTERDCQPGLSPHAPYTVHPRLLRALVALGQDYQVPLAMHLAESPEELELLRAGTGPFRESLERLGAWDPSAEARLPRVLDYLEQLSAAPRALVVHGNYLEETELRYLAERSSRMSLVYCPRTHDFFEHEPYRLAERLAAGVHVALGTDSRASNPDLNLLAEMQFVATRHPNVPLSTVLELGTINGARALGREDDFGTLAVGKLARLTIVNVSAQQAVDPHELFLARPVRVGQTWTGTTCLES